MLFFHLICLGGLFLSIYRGLFISSVVFHGVDVTILDSHTHLLMNIYAVSTSLTIAKSIAVNSFTHISLGKCAWIFIGHIRKSGITQRVYKICKLFINIAKLVSKNTFIISQRYTWEISLFPCILTNPRYYQYL